jgi:hypothetical protein
VSVTVQPPASLADQPVHIGTFGLAPGEEDSWIGVRKAARMARRQGRLLPPAETGADHVPGEFARSPAER